MQASSKTITALVSSLFISWSGVSHAFLGNFFFGSGTGEEDSEEAIISDAQLFVLGKNPKLQPFFYNLWVEGERNSVLNFQYLGRAAMEVADYDTAKAAFDEAILRIESIYADDPNAEKAKSLWHGEEIKDFKGEPYERSMTYYYRGLLYLRDGDYQNARASFLSADRHDTLSELERYQGDFGLMNYLAAWSSYCDDDLLRAKELHQRASSQDPGYFSSLAYTYPYLVLIDAGLGPTKNGKGEYEELLTITPTPKGEDKVIDLNIGRANTKIEISKPVEVGNVTFQATTRGGRPIQGILNGKAQFKENANAIGQAAIDVGTMAMLSGAFGGNQDMMNAGAIMGLFGLISKSAAEATIPKADVRTWSTLPHSIYISYSKMVPSSTPTIEVVYQNDGERRNAAIKLTSHNGKCGFAWGHTRSALTVAHNGFAKLTSPPEVVETDRGDKNRAFRSLLAERFSPGSLSESADVQKTKGTTRTHSSIGFWGE